MSFAILVAKPSSKSSAETSLSAVSLNFLYALAICAVALIILKLTISLAKNHFNDIFIEESQILSISQRRNGLLPYFLSYNFSRRIRSYAVLDILHSHDFDRLSIK